MTMSRPPKYTIEDIKKVHHLMNKEALNKRQAIKKAGFSDSSLYYNTLKRLRVKEFIQCCESL